MTQEECPFRSSIVLHDDKGEFHLCNREGGDCECIPSGCPYLIAKNSKLNLPDLPGYVKFTMNKEYVKNLYILPKPVKKIRIPLQVT